MHRYAATFEKMQDVLIKRWNDLSVEPIPEDKGLLDLLALYILLYGASHLLGIILREGREIKERERGVLRSTCKVLKDASLKIPKWENRISLTAILISRIVEEPENLILNYYFYNELKDIIEALEKDVELSGDFFISKKKAG